MPTQAVGHGLGCLGHARPRAHHHIVVSKGARGGITTADLRVVDDEARVTEVARMLGGDLPSNPIFENDNRGKRSIVLDLASEAGRGVALELLDQVRDLVQVHVLRCRFVHADLLLRGCYTTVSV